MVKVQDYGGLKFVVKLLVHPDARLFQCEDSKRRCQKEQGMGALKRNDTITRRGRERLLRASIRKNPFLCNEVAENVTNPYDEKEEDPEEENDNENEVSEDDAEFLNPLGPNNDLDAFVMKQ